MVVGSGDSVGDCASKKACKSALFLCLRGCDSTDELAVVELAWGCEMTLLGVERLV